MEITNKVDFKIGDLIEFDFFGRKLRGKIMHIGNHGYWIKYNPGCGGSGRARCPFEAARPATA